MPEPHDASRFTVWLNNSMESRRLTQADLARAVGVGDAQVSRWRRGQVVPTVRSLQRLADTFGVPRVILDSLAGYPSGEPDEQQGAPDDLARLAEIRAYQAWFGEQLAERVPRELWRVYADGCAALAQALGDSYRATLARAEGLDEGESPGEGELPAVDRPPRREIGFRS